MKLEENKNINQTHKQKTDSERNRIRKKQTHKRLNIQYKVAKKRLKNKQINKPTKKQTDSSDLQNK